MTSMKLTIYERADPMPVFHTPKPKITSTVNKALETLRAALETLSER